MDAIRALVAARGRACGNIASDHATRADHGIISDGHARQNDRTAADPHILTDPDGRPNSAPVRRTDGSHGWSAV